MSLQVFDKCSSSESGFFVCESNLAPMPTIEIEPGCFYLYIKYLDEVIGLNSYNQKENYLRSYYGYQSQLLLYCLNGKQVDK